MTSIFLATIFATIFSKIHRIFTKVREALISGDVPNNTSSYRIYKA